MRSIFGATVIVLLGGGLLLAEASPKALPVAQFLQNHISGPNPGPYPGPHPGPFPEPNPGPNPEPFPVAQSSSDPFQTLTTALTPIINQLGSFLSLLLQYIVCVVGGLLNSPLLSNLGDPSNLVGGILGLLSSLLSGGPLSGLLSGGPLSGLLSGGPLSSILG